MEGQSWTREKSGKQKNKHEWMDYDPMYQWIFHTYCAHLACIPERQRQRAGTGFDYPLYSGCTFSFQTRPVSRHQHEVRLDPGPRTSPMTRDSTVAEAIVIIYTCNQEGPSDHPRVRARATYRLKLVWWRSGEWHFISTTSSPYRCLHRCDRDNRILEYDYD